MKFNIKEKFNYFLKDTKDYPVLAAFNVGFYGFVFYFSNNFDSVNSWQQTFFFLFYFIIGSIILVFSVYKLVQKSKYSRFATQSILFMMLFLLPIYLLDRTVLFDSYKRAGLFLILVVILILFIVKFKIKNYKYLIVFVFFMSFLPTLKLGEIIYLNFTNSSKWQLQPDNILETKFKNTPNIYYIQPDGYANETNLKDNLYHFDNSTFDNWLKHKKFTLYENNRSNYPSTLSSNSSSFFMKHHFFNEYSNFVYARDLIVGENPVLRILKDNNYKTFFISERPYLLINKPKVYYDYCNFKSDELPYFNDGWTTFKEITAEIKSQINNNKKTNNFFFIQKFSPGHIAVRKKADSTIESERAEYLTKLKIANDWLKEIIGYIEKNDPNSIIIIGADHAGFVGFEYTLQSMEKITDPQLLNSIFGAKLAIKWNNPIHKEYDVKLKTSVNLFRVLFSYLSEDKLLLDNLQPNASYNEYDVTNLKKVYKAFDEN